MRDLMLIAGCFKFALMRGTRFRHRSAKLNSFQLETKPSSGWRRGWTRIPREAAAFGYPRER